MYMYVYMYNVLQLHSIAKKDMWSTNRTARSRVWALLLLFTLPCIYLLKRECAHITYLYRYISECICIYLSLRNHLQEVECDTEESGVGFVVRVSIY